MVPRQIKVFSGIGSGSFTLDSLGNTWLNTDSWNNSGTKFDSYMTPGGTGNTIGGVLTWRGFTLDLPILADSMVQAYLYYRPSTVGIRTIIIEWGKRLDTFAYDYTAAGEFCGQNGTVPTSPHYGVGWTTTISTIPNPAPGPFSGSQLWIYNRMMYISPTGGTAPPYNPTAPADFTLVYDDGLDGLYYRWETTGPADGQLPYTITGHTVSGNDIMIFQLMTPTGAPPAYVPPIPVPLVPQIPCNPNAQISGGGKGKSGCNTGGIGRLLC